jgi:hypothetical protein
MVFLASPSFGGGKCHSADHQSQHTAIAFIHDDYLCVRRYLGKDCLPDLLDKWEDRPATRSRFEVSFADSA